MSNVLNSAPWLDCQFYTVGGIKMVYMKNKADADDDYICTYDMGMLKRSQLELMGFRVERPRLPRMAVNPREVMEK